MVVTLVEVAVTVTLIGVIETGICAVPRLLIAYAVNVIVVIAGRGIERRVQEIATVLGVIGKSYRLEPLTHPEGEIACGFGVLP